MFIKYSELLERILSFALDKSTISRLLGGTTLFLGRMMSQTIIRRVSPFGIAFAATIVAFLVFTAASARAEPDQVIYECVNNSSGTTHIITPTPTTPPDPTTACHKN